MNKKDIFKEKSGNDFETIRFAYPGVKSGSVIEMRYTEKTQYSFNLSSWPLQNKIPTKLTVFKLQYPSTINVAEKLTANFPIYTQTDTSSSGIITCTRIGHSIKALRNEPMMTSVKDNQQGIWFVIAPTFSAFSTSVSAGFNYVPQPLTITDKWRDFGDNLLKSPFLGGQLNIIIPGTEAQMAEIKGLSTDQKKIYAAYNLVKQNVSSTGGTGFSMANIALAWQNKAGTKTEINLLLLNFLLKAGIHAYPLLVSTLENGKTDSNFPDFYQFNGTDICIDDSNGGFYVMDGTRKDFGYKRPPFDVLNRNALLLAKNNSRWICINGTAKGMENTLLVKAYVDSSGRLRGNVLVSSYGYARDEDTGEASRSIIQNDFSNVVSDNLKLENVNDELQPLLTSFRFTSEMPSTGNFYFFDPFFLSSLKQNPFTDSLRQTVVDFMCKQDYDITISLSLPSNIYVDGLPANKELQMADSSFYFSRLTEKLGNAILIKWHLRLLNPIFTVADYPFLKQAFEKMYALLNERIVFNKTN